jgi:hypothetical protein
MIAGDFCCAMAGKLEQEGARENVQRLALAGPPVLLARQALI